LVVNLNDRQLRNATGFSVAAARLDTSQNRNNRDAGTETGGATIDYHARTLK
jgi:hypothetical protein